MSTSVSVYDEDRFYEAMASVRADDNETKWALFGHRDGNPNEIECVGVGTDGPEEMAEMMVDSQHMYGLVRLEQTFDMSITVKFVHVHLVGKDVPFAKRGKFGVVHGAIESLFDHYNVMIDVDSKDEVTLELLETKLQETSGTRNKVLEASEAKVRPERGFTSGTTTKIDPTGTTPTRSSHMTGIGKAGSSFGGVSKQAKSSGIVVTQEVCDAVEAVKSDKTETDWCVAGYENNNVKNPIILLESGSGQVDELKELKLLPDDQVVYAYIRLMDKIDDIPTVKFVFIQWIGESTKIMTKAKVATHKGGLEDVFKPVHVSISASNLAEISHRAISDKVATASGSKSRVK